jgi:hypothetical protein
LLILDPRIFWRYYFYLSALTLERSFRIFFEAKSNFEFLTLFPIEILLGGNAALFSIQCLETYGLTNLFSNNWVRLILLSGL